MAVEQQTLGTSSLLVDVTDTGHGIANPAADLAEADLVEADGKQARLSRSSSLGQDPDQIEVILLMNIFIKSAEEKINLLRFPFTGISLTYFK